MAAKVAPKGVKEVSKNIPQVIPRLIQGEPRPETLIMVRCYENIANTIRFLHMRLAL